MRYRGGMSPLLRGHVKTQHVRGRALAPSWPHLFRAQRRSCCIHQTSALYYVWLADLQSRFHPSYICCRSIMHADTHGAPFPGCSAAPTQPCCILLVCRLRRLTNLKQSPSHSTGLAALARYAICDRTWVSRTPKQVCETRRSNDCTNRQRGIEINAMNRMLPACRIVNQCGEKDGAMCCECYGTGHQCMLPRGP